MKPRNFNNLIVSIIKKFQNVINDYEARFNILSNYIYDLPRNFYLWLHVKLVNW